MLVWAFAACMSGAVFAAQPTEPSRLSVGANVVGAQIAYSFNPSWRGEVRHVTGKQSADAGTIKTQVNGVRAYRLFGGGKTRFYLGGEADYVAGTQDHSAYRSTGQGPGDLSVWRGA